MFSLKSLVRLSVYAGRRNFHLYTRCLSPIIVKMPSLSPTMTDGGIVEWHKKEGEVVAAGDLLCEIQTDKAVMGMEADEDGTLAKILKPANSQGIQVGEVIAVLAESDEDWQSVEVPVSATAAPPAAPAAAPPADASTVAPTVTSATAPHHVDYDSLEGVGPAGRLLMESHNIDPDKVPHSGPHGNIVKADVLKYITEHNLKPVAAKVEPPKAAASTPSTPVKAGAPAAYVDIPLTSMRKTIAKRLTQSKSTIPHSYTTIRCCVDALMDNRKRLKEKGIKVSVNDYVIKACAMALRAVPEINASMTANGQVHFNHNVDISVAVATDSGLITPILPGTDALGLMEINHKVSSLAEKARAGKLQPHEYLGGTFTISNLGMFGIKEFTAIINPPQSCILSVGSSLPVATAPGVFSSLLAVSLSWDARHLDDVLAARFLGQVRAGLENPGILEIGLRGMEGDPFDDMLELGFD